MIEAFLGAMFFGLASYIGILLAGTISTEPFDDGPAPAEPPVRWILVGAALVGALAAGRSDSAQHIVMQAVIICSLSAIWCTDMRYGIVPDAFTLIPLAIIAGLALAQHDIWPMVSAVVAFVPFAAMAIASKGHGMGWGDVKLAALGGAVLGFETALLAFAVGAIVAVLYAFARRRQREVIAFAPYLAGAIAVALPLSSL
ncbi:MAG TPA: A24 family peptidase [Candidatus Baltobacteraceae bacterium]|nr:A24 family peptidase [Candidatus Baltobacteraceae bacterium]